MFITPNRPQADIFKNVIISMASVKSWCQLVYQKEREKQEENITWKDKPVLNISTRTNSKY